MDFVAETEAGMGFDNRARVGSEEGAGVDAGSGRDFGLGLRHTH